MTHTNTRLTDEQLATLHHALVGYARRATRTEEAEYPLAADPDRHLGVLRAFDLPRKGLTTSASFGFANETWQHRNFPDRIELVQAWDNPSTDYERLMVTVIESALAERQHPKPGILYQDAARAADLPDLAERMPHATVLYPYLWKNGFHKVDLGTARVWFLQVVPLYQNESDFIEKHGIKKFEERLEYTGARFERLQRVSHLDIG